MRVSLASLAAATHAAAALAPAAALAAAALAAATLSAGGASTLRQLLRAVFRQPARMLQRIELRVGKPDVWG